MDILVQIAVGLILAIALDVIVNVIRGNDQSPALGYLALFGAFALFAFGDVMSGLATWQSAAVGAASLIAVACLMTGIIRRLSTPRQKEL